jgi:hypothetical protein
VTRLSAPLVKVRGCEAQIAGCSLLEKWGHAVPSLTRHFWPCLEAIIESVNSRKKITYGQLADRLGLKLAQQEWNTVLDLIAGKTKRDVGRDLTWTSYTRVVRRRTWDATSAMGTRLPARRG